MSPAVLVVGAGLLGHAIGRALRLAGCRVLAVSRRAPANLDTPPAVPWAAADATDPTAVAALICDFRPQAIVLAHGPGSVNEIERSPCLGEIHARVIHNFLSLAPDSFLCLISTDNVFAGHKDYYRESDVPDPANAYGRAKLAAEQLLDPRRSLIIRVSMCYGSRAGTRPNFALMCCRTLLAGRPIALPADQWLTPVDAADVATVVASCLATRTVGHLHVGGPDRLSRYELGGLCAQALGISQDLVIPGTRSGSYWASRPESSCLVSERWELSAGTRGIRLSRTADGISRMAASIHPRAC